MMHVLQNSRGRSKGATLSAWLSKGIQRNLKNYQETRLEKAGLKSGRARSSARHQDSGRC